MAVIKSTENKIKNQAALVNAIEYITKKSENVSFSDRSFFNSPQETAEFFKQIREAHRQTTGIFAHHYVQSFSPDDKISAEQAHEIGIEFAKKVAPGYQVLIATHTDRDHIHNHILINSVHTEAGYKWHDNNKTIRHMHKVSDELCKKHALSVIGETSKKGIDRATYQLALQGKSWKIELAKTLDEAVLVCKSRVEFIDFLNKRGFKVSYKNKNITVLKIGEKKSIRVDTLARQFGDKYKKENLERTMGYCQRGSRFSPPKFAEKPPQKSSEKENIESPGEWARYEKWFFEQIALSGKSAIIENSDKILCNIYSEKLINSDGENLTTKVNLLDLVRLETSDFFFFAEKNSDFAEVKIKKSNREKLESRVKILDEVEKIIAPEVSKTAPEAESEKAKNAKINAKIKKLSAFKGVKPCYKIVNEKQLEILKSTGIEFAFFARADGKFNTVFLKEHEAAINAALKNSYGDGSNAAKLQT